ncbi:MAG: hypothetical protein JSV86_06230 [Gemmatimonadota bacterium]|nr:MAG: hypothetical protein JSV86_06230 [Gemmatimonadota bacterium]
MQYVNVYLVDQAYGGPEEGGWWYDWGVPHVSIPEECPGGIYTMQKLWQAWCDKENDARPDYCSVHGQGEYRVSVEDEPARAWPSERPFYE